MKFNVAQSNKTVFFGDTVQELGSHIMVIYQDKKNVYWFGSFETGVYRYDGKSLINYSIKHGLPNNRIDQITEDQNGNIYFVSCHPNSTITKYDGQSFFIVQTLPSTDWKLQDNDLWLKNAYQTQKVYRFDGNTFFELTLPKPPSLPISFEIYSIYKDKKGNIWFGTNPVGVCRYDGKSFDWITEEDVTEFRQGGANGVRSITEDQNGDFWFNTENRYSVYDSSTFKSGKFYKRHKSIGSLDGENTSGLTEYLSSVRDNENNLWFVTYRDGVWKYDGSKITQFKVQENSKDITLFCIYKDNKGDLWLGTHNNGAYIFNGNAFLKFNPKKQSSIEQIHPTIQTIFYSLPLDKSRLELREMILNDKRFVLTDTTFNNFPPSSFFKGLTTDKGLIEAKPDSIQVMLIYGNAVLVTEKGGQQDTTKHPMILECKYFYANKESVELEYRRLLNLVQPIFTDSSSNMDDNWETDYASGQQNGIQKCSGKIFNSYEPYYRVAISMISYIPSDDAQPYFVLDIAFSKEDK